MNAQTRQRSNLQGTIKLFTSLIRSWSALHESEHATPVVKRFYARWIVRVRLKLVRARLLLRCSFPPQPRRVFHFNAIFDHMYLFRFNANHIVALASSLLPDPVVAFRRVGPQHKLVKQVTMPAVDALCVVLYHLSYPRRLDDQANFFGTSQGLQRACVYKFPLFSCFCALCCAHPFLGARTRLSHSPGPL